MEISLQNIEIHFQVLFMVTVQQNQHTFNNQKVDITFLNTDPSPRLV